MAGRARRGGYAERMVPMRRPGESGISNLGSGSDLKTLLIKIQSLIGRSDIDKQLEEDIDALFCQLCIDKDSVADVLFNIHFKSVSDTKFATQAVKLLERHSHLEVDGLIVRSEFMKYLQKDFQNREETFGHEKTRQKFRNEVWLLGQFFHRIKVQDVVISILGIALLEYLTMLLGGDEEDVCLLAEQVILNGKLMQGSPQVMKQYERLKYDLRTRLIGNDLSSLSRSWLLLCVDVMSPDSVSLQDLKGVLRDFYLANIGQGFEELEKSVYLKEQVAQLSTDTKSLVIENPSKPVQPVDEPEYHETEVDRVKERMRMKIEIEAPQGSIRDAVKSESDIKTEVDRVRERIRLRGEGVPSKTKTEGVRAKSEKSEQTLQQNGRSFKSDVEKAWGVNQRTRNDHIEHDDRFDKDDDFYGIQAPRRVTKEKTRFGGSNSNGRGTATPLQEEASWD